MKDSQLSVAFLKSHFGHSVKQLGEGNVIWQSGWTIYLSQSIAHEQVIGIVAPKDRANIGERVDTTYLGLVFNALR